MAKGTELKERVAAQNAAMQAGTTPAKEGELPTNVMQFVTSPTSRRELTRLLGSEEMSERWMRIALTECRREPKLLKCTMESFAGALMLCAQLKLEPGPALELAWIIPFNNRVPGTRDEYRMEATFVIGYPGVIQLAMRSQQLASIAGRSVCEGDEFAFDYLAGERRHKVALRGVPGPAYGYYCHARYANGGEHFLYMTREQVVAHRDRYSKAAKYKTGPWFESDESFDKMAQKTTILQSRRYLPASPDFILALKADERRAEWTPTRGLLIDEDDLNLLQAAALTEAAEAPAEEQKPEQQKEVDQDGVITKGAESQLPLNQEK